MIVDCMVTSPLSGAPARIAAGAGRAVMNSRVRRQAFGCRLPPLIFSQVPAGTSTNEAGSASTVEWPAQVWLPALQSFLPALATPKHFSWSSALTFGATDIVRATASAEATRIAVFMWSFSQVVSAGHSAATVNCYHAGHSRTTASRPSHALVMSCEPARRGGLCAGRGGRIVSPAHHGQRGLHRHDWLEQRPPRRRHPERPVPSLRPRRPAAAGDGLVAHQLRPRDRPGLLSH